MDIERVLIEQGFTKYRHQNGYIVWSIEDLIESDDFKEWFLV